MSSRLRRCPNLVIGGAFSHTMYTPFTKKTQLSNYNVDVLYLSKIRILCPSHAKYLLQTCVKKFMEIVEETLINFSHADTKLDPLSDEMKLVEALCGTLTSKFNISDETCDKFFKCDR